MSALLPRIIVIFLLLCLIGAIALIGNQPLALLAVFVMPSLLEYIPVFPPIEYAQMEFGQPAQQTPGEYDGSDTFSGFSA